MFKIIFNYESIETEVQCKQENKMKKIFEHFCQKRGLGINNLIFNYNGSIINEELELNQLVNSLDRERKILNILVFSKEGEMIKETIEKSKDIICPKCREKKMQD